MSNSNPPADKVFVEDNGPERPIEENLKSRGTWMRLLFMVICAILLSITSFVGGFVVVLGFLWVLVTGEVNRQIRDAGQSIAAYVYQIIRYLTFNTEDRPFPLGGDWPSSTSD